MTAAGERIAFHEAGHAVVSVRLGQPFKFVSIIPDESSRGYLWTGYDLMNGAYSNIYSRTKRFASVCLAGALAERLAFRKATPGIDGDLECLAVWLNRHSKLFPRSTWRSLIVEANLDAITILFSQLGWEQVQAIAWRLQSEFSLQEIEVYQTCEQVYKRISSTPANPNRRKP